MVALLKKKKIVFSCPVPRQFHWPSLDNKSTQRTHPFQMLLPDNFASTAAKRIQPWFQLGSRKNVCYYRSQTSGRSWSRSSIPRQGRYVRDLYDLYDLYDLAHVAGWEPHNLHDLGAYFLGWVSVLHRSCRISHNGRLGSRSSRSSRPWSVRV